MRENIRKLIGSFLFRIALFIYPYNSPRSLERLIKKHQELIDNINELKQR